MTVISSLIFHKMASNFILREDAREWFKPLPMQSKAKLFEAYYYCAIAGLAFKVKSDVPQGVPPFLAHLHFPEDFNTNSKLLVGLLISSEMEILGIKSGSRKDVYEIVSRIVTNDNSTGLSDEGVSQLNRYASGGFCEIMTRMSSGTNSYPIFVQEFSEMISQA